MMGQSTTIMVLAIHIFATSTCITTYKTTPWLGKMRLQGEVITAHTAWLLDRLYEREHLPCSVPSHEDALQYVRTVWQVLLSAMYGRSPAFHPDAPTYSLVLFIANLLECADYLMLDEKVRSLLQHSILDVPGIWDSVRDNPRGFLQLGYMLRVPNLYLDAARHLIDKTYPGCFEINAIRATRIGLQELPWFNAEMLELLHSGSKALQERVIRLSRQLIATVTLKQAADAPLYSYSRGPMNDGDFSFSGKRAIDVAKILCSTLAPQVLDVAYTLLLDTIGDGAFVLSCGPGQAAFKKLKELHQSLSEQTNGDLERKFGLQQLAHASGFHVPMLRADMKTYMNHIRTRIEHSHLLESSEHEYIANSSQKDNPLGRPMHYANCARCFRARAQNDAYFIFFNTRHVKPVGLGTPWPIRDIGGPCPHQKQMFLEETKTIPASLEWLSKIGIGNKFKHLQARDTRKRPRLTSDTETKGYMQESVALIFAGNDTSTKLSDEDGDDQDCKSILTPYLRTNTTQDPDPLASKFDFIDWEALTEAAKTRPSRYEDVLEQLGKEAPCDCKLTDLLMRDAVEKRRRLRQQWNEGS